jgi:hypothetical protein
MILRSFKAPVTLPLGAMDAVIVTDYDDDGFVDLAFSGNGAVSLARGDGHGAFRLAERYPMTFRSVIGAGELDGTPGGDIVVVDTLAPHVTVLRHPCVKPPSPR